MSKKRHRNKDKEETKCCANCRNKTYGNNFLGLSPAQIMSLLGGNTDVNALGSLLSSMKTNGFDFNNFSNMNKANKNSIDINKLQDIVLNTNNSNIDIDGEVEANQEVDLRNNFNQNGIEDENIQMLLAIRNIVDLEKAKFLDRIIEAYQNGDFK